MSEVTPRTDRRDDQGKYIPYPANGIPKTRTNALSVLRAAGDDPKALTEPQRQAICRLYRINGDTRSVQELLESGVLQP